MNSWSSPNFPLAVAAYSLAALAAPSSDMASEHVIRGPRPSSAANTEKAPIAANTTTTQATRYLSVRICPTFLASADASLATAQEVRAQLLTVWFNLRH